MKTYFHLTFFLTLAICRVRSFEFSLGPTSSGVNISKLYEPHFRPNNGAVSDMISVSIDELNIIGIDDNNMKININLKLKTSWTDPRLMNVVNKTTIFIQNIPNVWIPDITIQYTTSIEQQSNYMVIKPGGEIHLTKILTVNVPCFMSSFQMPFEKHECPIKFKSQAYPTLQLDMVWNGNVDISRIQFYNMDYKFLSLDQISEKERNSDGEYRNLIAVVKFRRNGFKYVKTLMLPGIIFGIISYSTLFIIQKYSKEDTTKLQQYSTPLNLHLTKILISFLTFITYQFITQLYYTGSSSSTMFTCVDIYISIILIIQVILLFYNIIAFILSLRHVPESDDIQQQEYKLKSVRKILITGIPISFVLFLIIYSIIFLF